MVEIDLIHTFLKFLRPRGSDLFNGSWSAAKPIREKNSGNPGISALMPNRPPASCPSSSLLLPPPPLVFQTAPLIPKAAYGLPCGMGPASSVFAPMAAWEEDYDAGAQGVKLDLWRPGLFRPLHHQDGSISNRRIFARFVEASVAADLPASRNRARNVAEKHKAYRNPAEPVFFGMSIY